MSVRAERISGERRADLRVDVDLPVKVCGTTAYSIAFDLEGIVENISRSGLFLRLPSLLNVGTRVLIFVEAPGDSIKAGLTPDAVMRGVVIRAEAHVDGKQGAGVSILHRRDQPAEITDV